MTSLRLYDIRIPYDGDEATFYSFKEALMEKFAEAKIFHIFKAPQEQMHKPRKLLKLGDIRKR